MLLFWIFCDILSTKSASDQIIIAPTVMYAVSFTNFLFH